MFLEQPEAYAKVAKDDIRLVCKVKISIYGIKQANKNWYDRLKSFLLDESLQQSESDNCRYVKREESSLIFVS